MKTTKLFLLFLMFVCLTRLSAQELLSDTTVFNRKSLIQTRSLTTPTWLQGSNSLYTSPDINVGIGTAGTDDKLRIDYGTVGNYNGDVGIGIRTLGNSANTSNLDARIEARINVLSHWSSQSQAMGVYSKMWLKRTASPSYSNINSAGFFNIAMEDYSHSGNNEGVISSVYGHLMGTITSHPSVGIVSAVLGRDKINDGKTWAGYFEGRSYFDGNVGIGVDPTVKLEVAGTIKATELIIEAQGQTADFVFEENYTLRDLSEVESFIKTNKHLPEIPSASKMEDQGVNIAEMNKLLLMKVEELTLYLIKQQREIDVLKSKLNN